MAQAALQNTTLRLSTLFRDPALRAAFERAERDTPPELVEPKRPEPVLAGGTAREMEVA